MREIAHDEALEALSAVEPRPSQVVELRFFGGFTVEETAETLGVSARTAINDWKPSSDRPGREQIHTVNESRERKLRATRAIDAHACRGRTPQMGHEVEQELITVAREWDRAMVQNDAEDIGRYMADDWTIVGSDGSITDRARFLDLVRSGILSHDVMESDDFRVRVYGDAAVLLARSISGGAYQGGPFREREQTSNVFIKQQGQWRCVLTHLSRLGGPSSGIRGAG